MVNTIIELTKTADELNMDNLNFEYYDSKLKTTVKVNLFKDTTIWGITTIYEAKDNVGIWTEYKKIFELIDNELNLIDKEISIL